MRVWAAVAAAVCCVLALLGLSPMAFAQPVPPPDPAIAPVAAVPLPPDAVASAESGYLKTPDGWELTAGAKDETQVAVAPLTTALTSREYVVGGTFTGTVTGQGSTELTGGSLVVGYRIGCGIIGGPVEVLTSVGVNQQFDTANILGQVVFPVNNQIKINLRPGTVTLVPVGEKTFKGDETRVTVTGFRVRVDGCVGQSFLQSYSTLTSSTADTSDIVTYTGQVKVV
jgi:hypothetical protein